MWQISPVCGSFCSVRICFRKLHYDMVLCIFIDSCISNGVVYLCTKQRVDGASNPQLSATGNPTKRRRQPTTKLLLCVLVWQLTNAVIWASSFSMMQRGFTEWLFIWKCIVGAWNYHGSLIWFPLYVDAGQFQCFWYINYGALVCEGDHQMIPSGLHF